MGISKRNPRGNFNWQSRILKKKAQCCGLIDEFVPPTTNCYCYTITTVSGSCSISYIDCSGTPQTVSSGGDPIYICAQEGTVIPSCLAPANSVNITGGTQVCTGNPPDPLPPLGAISGPSVGVCGASNVNYSLSTFDADSYNWIPPTGASINGSSSFNAVNVDFGPGFTSGYLTVQAFYGCAMQSTDIFIDGTPPTPTIDIDIICPGLDNVYTVSSTGATSYNWTITGDDFNLSSNPPVNSSYYILWGASGGTISVTASNSCGTSAPLILSTYCP